MPFNAVAAGVKLHGKEEFLVIGGGFDGVFAAKKLARRGRDEFDIELINNNNYFVFQPLLPEVAAPRSAPTTRSRRCGSCYVAFRSVKPTMGVDFDKKTVRWCRASAVSPSTSPYGELVIALGISVDLNRFPGLPEHALTMKNLSDRTACAPT